MASKARITDKDNGFNAFFAGLKQLREKRVKVGIQGPSALNAHPGPDGGLGGITMVELGAVHEFGAVINNGFGRGIKIVIPQRSFLRSTADENKNKYQRAMVRIGRKLVKAPKRFNATAELTIFGEKIRRDVIKKIKGRIPPPLKPATIARKGEDVPLIDEGILVGSIRSVVE